MIDGGAGATLTVPAGTLSAVDILEQSAADRIAASLAAHACAGREPAAPDDPDHDHDACLDAPGAALADRLWRIAAAVAAEDWKAARTACRRLDVAIGARELR